MTATAINDVILAIVTAVDNAVAYPVFDGPPSTLPSQSETKFVAIGAEAPLTDDTAPVYDAATMSQVWKGLGQPMRDEELRINCVAVGKSTSVAAARALAISVLDDVADSIGIHPGDANVYNALISQINTTRVRNVPGGAVVQIQFMISAHANLFKDG